MLPSYTAIFYAETLCSKILFKSFSKGKIKFVLLNGQGSGLSAYMPQVQYSQNSTRKRYFSSLSFICAIHFSKSDLTSVERMCICDNRGRSAFMARRNARGCIASCGINNF